jgi:hypothetical protein
MISDKCAATTNSTAHRRATGSMRRVGQAVKVIVQPRDGSTAVTRAFYLAMTRAIAVATQVDSAKPLQANRKHLVSFARPACNFCGSSSLLPQIQW